MDNTTQLAAIRLSIFRALTAHGEIESADATAVLSAVLAEVCIEIGMPKSNFMAALSRTWDLAAEFTHKETIQ